MRSRLRIAAIASLSTVALMVGTAATAYADANPSNNGHHYGQLKHPKAPPSPSPSPNPGGQPTPTTHPAVAITVTTPAPITISITLGPVASPVASGQIEPVLGLPELPGNEDDWLLLLILPSLIAVWVIAAIGLVRRLSRVGRKPLVTARVPA